MNISIGNISVERIADGVWRQWNFVNSLTAFRALAVIPAVLFQYFGMSSTVLFVLIALAVISDGEGFVARWTDTTTSFGKVFDPLADKLFTNTMLLMYLFAYDGGLLVLVLLVCNLGYDIDNSSRRIRDIAQGCLGCDVVESTPVTLLSKWKTALLFGGVMLMFTPTNLMTVPSLALDIVLVCLILLVCMSWWNNRKRTVLSFIQ